jgi:hypothetical protein
MQQWKEQALKSSRKACFAAAKLNHSTLLIKHKSFELINGRA